MTPGEVELAADHQQRDRYGHDADRRGGVQHRAEARGPYEAVGEDREEEEDRDRADHGKPLGPSHESAQGRGLQEALVDLVWATARVQARWRSSGPPLGVLLERGGLILGDDLRTGEDRLAAAEDIGVVLVEPQQVHGLVPLEVGLLVDREAECAVLELRGHLRVQVEGVDLGLAAASAFAFTAVSAYGAPSVTTVSMDLSACSLAPMENCTSGMLVPWT